MLADRSDKLAKLISASKGAKALGITRQEFTRLAQKVGIGCIFARVPASSYSRQSIAGRKRYYIPDVIKMIDQFYQGDEKLLRRIIRDLESHNDSKAHIVNDNSELANKLISEGAKVVGDTVWQEVTSR